MEQDVRAPDRLIGPVVQEMVFQFVLQIVGIEGPCDKIVHAGDEYLFFYLFKGIGRKGENGDQQKRDGFTKENQVSDTGSLK